MNKICFVVQRYGLEVNGGAELLTRELAERMGKWYQVEVLTTKAVDYMTWKDEYINDTEDINGVYVRRFSVARERNQDRFNSINEKFLTGSFTKKAEEEEWINEQGPLVPSLVEYIRDHYDEYDVFLLCTYLYYPTVMGITEAASKAIVLPYAHDEPYIRMKTYDRVFLMPRAFFFLTSEERDLVRHRYNNYAIPYQIGGAGVDIPESIRCNKEYSAEKFKEKYGLDNYIVYVGRIDEGKNCPELFEFFLKFKQRNPSDLKLVLMGKAVIDIPENSDIVSLGFVSEEDKYAGIAGSKFLVIPSKFESLSIVVLEAFALKRPVLVDEASEVLKGHCIKSGGGYYYRKYQGFEQKMLKLLLHWNERNKMGAAGYEYVQKNYQWEVICRKLKMLIDKVAEGK